MYLHYCYVLIFNPSINDIYATAPWNIYVSLEILLPVVFLFLATSIKYMGL
jgi:hypothetical protein